MLSSNISYRCLTVTLAILYMTALWACNPRIYRKPLEDFKQANADMREAYFLQLEIAKEAEIEKFVTNKKRVLWGKSSTQLESEYFQRTADEIAKKRTEAIINEEVLKLRRKAFEVLDSYVGALLALSSDEDTDEIAIEIKGFVSDIEIVVEHANTLKHVSDFAGKVSEWTGPLSIAARAFTEIAKLVSRAVREKAIRDTIVEADSAIRELIRVLRSEAQIAQDEARTKYRSIEASLRKGLRKGVVDAAARRELLEYLAAKSATKKKLDDADDIARTFDLALEAQVALVKKAAKPEYADWLEHIRAFKTQVSWTKAALQELRREL